jgi:WD40 repeat protein
MSLGKNRLMVQSLSFNSRGNYLISMANDFHHTVCVFDWKNKGGPQKVREGQAHSGLCDTAKFNPYSDSAFASCGEKHVKFWEIGDSELEMAVGLFGDIGSPLDQRTVVFNPRGNAISGVRNGDIYVWASGNVQAKFEAAHKENVIGLLFVDGIGLFSVLIPFHFCVCAHCNILRAATCLAGLDTCRLRLTFPELLLFSAEHKATSKCGILTSRTHASRCALLISRPFA